MTKKNKKAKHEEQEAPVGPESGTPEEDVTAAAEDPQQVQEAVPAEESSGTDEGAAGGLSEADVLKDRLMRLQADFDNFRKRMARERAEWQTFAVERIIEDLLSVVDHYELGLATAEKHDADQAVLDGFRLVYDQFLGVFKKQGVEQISAAPGMPFNPHEHEAISHVPSEEHPADVIIAETRRGYKIGDKLVRPLQVVVSSGPAVTTETDGE
jgi:molecular chaperone GrpE